MPSVDDTQAQIYRLIEELEMWVAAADRVLSELQWEAVDHAFAEQRRVTHALGLMLESSDAPNDTPARGEINKRLQAIGEFRNGQLERLQAYNKSLGDRLTTVARFKGATRSMNSERPTSTLANLDQLR